MSINTKELCQWLRDHSSGAYRLSAEAATVIEELERENARLSAEVASRAVSKQCEQPVLYVREDDIPVNEGKYSHDSDARMFSIRGLDKSFAEFTVPLYRHGRSIPSTPSGYTHAPVEWTWKDTLEFVRKDFVSSEMYHKLRQGGSFDFNKRQLTNLLNGAFEYYLATPEVRAGLKPPTLKLPPMFNHTATEHGYCTTTAYGEGWNSCLAATMALNPSAVPAPETAAVADDKPNTNESLVDTATAPAPNDEQTTAIVAWWVGKRPFGWSEEQHLDEPAVYCTGAEKPLAMFAVQLAKASKSNANEVLADTATAPAPNDEQAAAIVAWWVGKRPFGWSEEEHLDEPTVYCTGAEKPLAMFAVQLAKARRT